MNAITKYLCRKYPDYDPERYHFKPGDIVTTSDGAVILVKESAIEYVTGYALKRSFLFRPHGENRVPYSYLPDLRKGKYMHPGFPISKSLRWREGTIVTDLTYGVVVYLYEEVSPQCFYGFVVKSENERYLHTGIYIPNPYKDYIAV